MEHIFGFKGGARAHYEGVKEKFFAFAIIGGKELFLHQAIRAGMVEPIDPYGHDWSSEFFADDFAQKYIFSSDGFYRTNIRYWKIFMAVQGFGLRRQSYSMVLDLYDIKERKPTVWMKPIGSIVREIVQKTGTASESWAYFLSKTRILSRDAAMDMVTGDSLMFMSKMPPMPVSVARQLLHVNKAILRKDVRSLKFRRKKKRSE